MNPAGQVPVRWIFESESSKRMPCGSPEVWTVRLDDPLVLAQARTVLSPEKEASARRFATVTLGNRYAAAHGALRILLGRWLGRDPREVRFFRNVCGKPFVEGGPYFSLSHAEGLAVVAIFPDREVGVDIERVRPFPAMADIAEQFFSSGERAWIAGGVPSESRFFRCWVLREAFVKALGEGLSFPLDRFCIRPPDDRGGDGVSLILKDGGSPDVDLTEWHPAEGFAGALAVRRQPFVGQDQGLS